MGADFEIPHEFKAGDTISAEMMNEIFEYIKNAQRMVKTSELVGTWSCTITAYSTSGESSCCTNVCNQLTKKTGINYYYYNNGTIVFSDDGDGTYSYITNPIKLFQCGGFNKFLSSDVMTANGEPHIGQGNVLDMINNVLFITYSTGGVSYANNISLNAGETRLELKRISSTKIKMINENAGDNKPTLYYECDKQNIPPTTPSTLTYSLPTDNSSSSITLTWTDDQTEAVTGYKVNRKTVVTDNFTTVSTITDNTTRTYADTNVSDNGTYWYRVLAYNSNGDGTPSKVVKASFPDDEAPTGTLKIDNATTTTTSSSVTLNLTATDNKGVVGYLASESSAPPSTDSTSWVSITSTTSYSADVSFTLSSGYGVKFVYVWFKDGKGNIAGYGASITYSSQ